jgi:hypothetical protein
VENENRIRVPDYAAQTRADADFACIVNPSVAPKTAFQENKYPWKFMQIPIDMKSSVSYHLDRFIKREV